MEFDEATTGPPRTGAARPDAMLPIQPRTRLPTLARVEVALTTLLASSCVAEEVATSDLGMSEGPGPGNKPSLTSLVGGWECAVTVLVDPALPHHHTSPRRLTFNNALATSAS